MGLQSLHIDAVTTDASDNSYGRLLRFKNTRGNWRTWSMPMSMLGGDGIDVRKNLLDMGVEIDPSQGSALVVRNICSDTPPRRRLTCALQTGWADRHFRAFVLPDTVIGPGAHFVTYQSDSHCHDEYSTSGTLPGWQAGVSSLAVGNPTLTLALCAAFAGPLLALCKCRRRRPHDRRQFHWQDDAIDAACSVWGGANMKRSWRTTSNGLEGVAALFNDAFLALMKSVSATLARRWERWSTCWATAAANSAPLAVVLQGLLPLAQQRPFHGRTLH